LDFELFKKAFFPQRDTYGGVAYRDYEVEDRKKTQELLGVASEKQST